MEYPEYQARLDALIAAGEDRVRRWRRGETVPRVELLDALRESAALAPEMRRRLPPGDTSADLLLLLDARQRDLLGRTGNEVAGDDQVGDAGDLAEPSGN